MYECMVGKTYNKLTVESIIGKNERWQKIIKCRCSCGEVVEKLAYRVKSGETKKLRNMYNSKDEIL